MAGIQEPSGRDDQRPVRDGRRRIAWLAAGMVALALAQAIAYALPFLAFWLKIVRKGRFTEFAWERLFSLIDPIWIVIYSWPVLIGVALLASRSPRVARAAALTFLASSLNTALMLVAAWFPTGPGAMGPGLSNPSLFELPGVALGLVLAWKSWRASRIGSVDDSRNGELAERYRAIAGRLTMACSILFVVALASGQAWTLFTEVLNRSRPVRDFVLKLDRLYGGRTAGAPRESERETRAHTALNSALENSYFGRFIEARKSYEGAIEAYSEVVLESAPPRRSVRRQLSLCYNNLAWLLASCPDPDLRDPVKAVELAEQAVKINSVDGNAWNTLGVAHYRAGNWETAMASLEKSMGLRQGGDSFDWYFLAMVHARLGEDKPAAEWFDKAVRWADEFRPLDEELYRFRVEAAGLLGRPVPPAPVISDQRRPFQAGPVSPRFPPPQRRVRQ
jgi:hypothetical protein